MAKKNFNEIEALLKAGDWEKIEALFTDVKQNKGGSGALDAMVLYAKVSKFLNTHYIKRLDGALSLARKINKAEKQTSKQSAIAQVRDRIRKMK